MLLANRGLVNVLLEVPELRPNRQKHKDYSCFPVAAVTYTTRSGILANVIGL